MGERNVVEGKFGEAKRNYGLGLIRARLRQSSETVIALQAGHEPGKEATASFWAPVWKSLEHGFLTP